MSRVTLGASLVLAVLCLSFSHLALAQSDGGRGGEGGAGGYGGAGGEGGYGGAAGGRGGDGGAGEPGTSATGGEYNREGEGLYGGARRGVIAADSEIEAALNAKLKAPLQYEDQPLNEVIDTLQEEYDIPILFDNAALEEVAISPDTELSINLRNITLRSALRLMLRQPGLEDLTFVVDDEVLLITTEEKANQKLEVKVYRVDDLVSGYSPRGGENNPYSSLVEVITRCVAFDSWMVNENGEGEIQLMLPGMLVVSNTREVHDQVQDLLEKLRTTHQEIEQSSSGSGMGGRGGGGRGGGGRF